MTDADRESESTDRGLDRRAVLKGTAVAGLAGSGMAGTASASGWHEIVFTAATHDVFEYWFEVSGRVKRGGRFQSDAWDEVGEDRVHGACDEKASDSFLFTGHPEKLRLKGLGKVFVDGELFEDATKDERLPNGITVESKGEPVRYKFRVSHRVEKGPNAGGTDEVIDANTVRGKVGGTIDGERDRIDDYRYSGAIAFDKADGPLTVTLELNDP